MWCCFFRGRRGSSGRLYPSLPFHPCSPCSIAAERGSEQSCRGPCHRQDSLRGHSSAENEASSTLRSDTDASRFSILQERRAQAVLCLLYTSDAADDLL